MVDKNCNLRAWFLKFIIFLFCYVIFYKENLMGRLEIGFDFEGFYWVKNKEKVFFLDDDIVYRKIEKWEIFGVIREVEDDIRWSKV